MSNESSDEDEDGSTGTASASGKPMKSKKYGKPTKSSKANSPLPQGNPASHDIANYDADNDRDNNTDLNSDDDHDSDLDDSDTKSNVSSKTSFSKRSIKSTNSTTNSPFLTPPSSSPPVKHPRPPPPPSPPGQISSDYVLKEERSWIWKEKWWEESLGKEKVKRRKKFNRDEWTGHPLFAAVTAVEVKKWDIIDLISNPSQKIQNGMMKRFFDSEIPFIAYVRTTGLEQGREEDLLEIVRSQILHVMASYEQNTETRKKEAISAAEGSLPLESRRFLLATTQEDLQRQFALPSWRRKGLEFLSADMVEMRRRKKVERIERERKMEEKRIHEKKLKELEMEQRRAREKEQGEKGKDELKDQQQQQQQQPQQQQQQHHH
ncbi:hypothetical protein N0V85_009769 [Neurospora sp. IMI 360204]|nr:hypothetical protein N0V85_009769 [Neurospora sp. IMI 360204]